MRHQDAELLEELSPEVADDIAEFRVVRPPGALMRSVRERWTAPVDPLSSTTRALRLTGAQKGVLMTALALTAAASALLAPVASQHAVFPVVEARTRQVSVVLPASGGAWVHLPWNANHPEGHPAALSLDAPSQLAVRGPHDLSPACRSQRCVYAWTSRAPHANTPLRVHIHEPGRYEFRVVHACRQRSMHERFIVLAMR